jgi:hypothetical protein
MSPASNVARVLGLADSGMQIDAADKRFVILRGKLAAQMEQRGELLSSSIPSEIAVHNE